MLHDPSVCLFHARSSKTVHSRAMVTAEHRKPHAACKPNPLIDMVVRDECPKRQRSRRFVSVRQVAAPWICPNRTAAIVSPRDPRVRNCRGANDPAMCGDRSALDRRCHEIARRCQLFSRKLSPLHAHTLTPAAESRHTFTCERERQVHRAISSNLPTLARSLADNTLWKISVYARAFCGEFSPNFNETGYVYVCVRKSTE